MKRELTQEQLKELLHYDPETGSFTWRVGRTGPKPKDGQAGNIHKHKGYRSIMIGGKMNMAHKLAWLYMTGEWPKNIVDHKNANRADNRWCNLREATHSQNVWNRGKMPSNKSGLKGVCWHERDQHWRAQGAVNGKKVMIGSFDCPAAAHFAYVVWADIHHGEFAKVA